MCTHRIKQHTFCGTGFNTKHFPQKWNTFGTTAALMRKYFAPCGRAAHTFSPSRTLRIARELSGRPIRVVHKTSSSSRLTIMATRLQGIYGLPNLRSRFDSTADVGFEVRFSWIELSGEGIFSEDCFITSKPNR
jgi:hypothetical protein